MAARKPHIDLLSREDFSRKPIGRFLLWALTVGRYIAIFTELVVIAGVIARFALDQQRNNITEDIIDQQAVLASYKDTETKIRNLNQKLNTISRLEKETIMAENLLTIFPQLTPIDMKYDSFTIDEKSIKIIGSTLSIQGFSTFLTNLQSNKEFMDIVLNSIETGGQQDPSIHFNIEVDTGRVIQKQTEPIKESEEVVL